ncbi:hypothetical protein MMC16_006625 [Acarospora aff. strigata]|nr:hypothetical protein [Acarospora aff. strigata]
MPRTNVYGLSSALSTALVSTALVSTALVSTALVSTALVSTALVSTALVSTALVSTALVSTALVSTAKSLAHVAEISRPLHIRNGRTSSLERNDVWEEDITLDDEGKEVIKDVWRGVSGTEDE